MSAELETVAEKFSVSPSNTVPEFGVMLMVMEGGEGGGGATEPAPPPPQPRVHAPIARRTTARTYSCRADKSLFLIVFVSHIRGRGRMPSRSAGQGPRRRASIQGRSSLPCSVNRWHNAHEWKKMQKFKRAVSAGKETSRYAPNRDSGSELELLQAVHSRLEVLPCFLPLTFLPATPIIRPWRAPTQFAE